MKAPCISTLDISRKDGKTASLFAIWGEVGGERVEAWAPDHLESDLQSSSLMVRI